MPKPLPEHLENSAFTVKDGRGAGLSRARMRGSDLVAPFPRIRMPARWLQPVGDSATVREKVSDKRRRVEAFARSAMLRMPVGSAASLASAAYLHSIPLPLRFLGDEVVHISVPRGTRAPVGKGIAGHQVTTRPGEITSIDGIPVTTVERTWCDLAALLDVPDLVAAGDGLIHRRARRTTKRALAAVARSYPTSRGRARRTASLALLNERAESPRESRLRVHLVQAGLPEPAVNPSIYYRGAFVGRVDMLYLTWGLIIEYEGEQHLTDVRQWQTDIARVNDFADIGLRTIRATAADDRDPSQLIERVRAHIAGGERRVAHDPAITIRW
ncbi:hypothetical protein [Paramicrobacterium agarici]|uniref:hypothetical protein n=1 Tax=Paramicrobacterium agarici TaxID=630514 RepID=UPI0011519AD6|nr:hypothetical protein [Microbacterium agarici]TQO22066.1 hypothetical protein FB385_0883 [Microbacterium agarici]